LRRAPAPPQRRVFAAPALVARVGIDGRRLQAESRELLRERAHPNTSTALARHREGRVGAEELHHPRNFLRAEAGRKRRLLSISVSNAPGKTAAQKMPRPRPSSQRLDEAGQAHLLAL